MTHTSGAAVRIQVGVLNLAVEEYFSNYPPLVRFVDLSELDGNLLIRPQTTQKLMFPQEGFETWDWEGVDIRQESIIKGDASREDSIQWRAAQQYIQGEFEVVFNDDAKGEAADLICRNLQIHPSWTLTAMHYPYPYNQIPSSDPAVRRDYSTWTRSPIFDPKFEVWLDTVHKLAV